MNRQERDSFTALTPTDIAYGEGACLETPPAVFQRLNERFRFDVDLTANEQNHLVASPNWFGPGHTQKHMQDALTVRSSISDEGWTAFGKSGFSNPAYGPFIPKILTKALEERDRGFTSVLLLPNRAGGWFTNLVLPYYSELWYVQPRITFWYQGKPRINPNTKTNRKIVAWNVSHPHEPQKQFKADGALFDSIVVVYKPEPMRARQGLLFPAPVDHRPNVWNWKTGELRY